MRLCQIVIVAAILMLCSGQTLQNSQLWPFLMQGRNINGNSNNVLTLDQQQQQSGSVSDVRSRQQQQFSVVHPEANNLVVQPTVSPENTTAVHHNMSNQAIPEKTTPMPTSSNIVGRNAGLFKVGSQTNRMITAGVALFGAVLGRHECELKVACLAGALLPEVQGREIALLVAEALVPAEWLEVYNAAKVSIIQRQDCSRFSCF